MKEYDKVRPVTARTMPCQVLPPATLPCRNTHTRRCTCTSCPPVRVSPTGRYCVYDTLTARTALVQAIETYQRGLELEPDNAELKDGLQRAVEAISRWGSSGVRSSHLPSHCCRTPAAAPLAPAPCHIGSPRPLDSTTALHPVHPFPDLLLPPAPRPRPPHRFASGQASAEEIKERQARSLADPEVQNMLKDPVVQQVCCGGAGQGVRVNRTRRRGMSRIVCEGVGRLQSGNSSCSTWAGEGDNERVADENRP